MGEREFVLECLGLTRIFRNKGKSFAAVSDVSFGVKTGEIVGLLGPNGAGKSTTIQMLLGVLAPTSGEVSYFNLPFDKHRAEILGKVAYVSGFSRMPWNLTVRENLDVHARLMGLDAHERHKRIGTLLDRFEVKHLMNQLFCKLSAGEATRTILAKAFLKQPSVALLDEPSAALDPDIAQVVRQFVIEQAKSEGVGIVYTSHNMAEVTQLCDRVIFMREGKIIAEDTPERLARTVAVSRLRLFGPQPHADLLSLLAERGFKAVISSDGVEIGIEDEHVSDLLAAIVSKGIKFKHLEIERPTLEEYFIKVSGGES